MRPWRAPSGQRRALIIGQVPTDAACTKVNFAQWANDAARHLKAGGFTVRFRPHPKAAWLRIGVPVAEGPVKFRDDRGLEADFDEADVVVTFNSNAGVLAALRGVPTVACDIGSMAWDAASHDLDEPIVTPDRTAWAHRLACCQWLPEELADGTAWAALRVGHAASDAAA